MHLIYVLLCNVSVLLDFLFKNHLHILLLLILTKFFVCYYKLYTILSPSFLSPLYTLFQFRIPIGKVFMTPVSTCVYLFNMSICRWWTFYFNVCVLSQADNRKSLWATFDWSYCFCYIHYHILTRMYVTINMTDVVCWSI